MGGSQVGIAPKYQFSPKAEVEFADYFNDGSIYWPWAVAETGAGRTVIESGDTLQCAITQTTDGRIDDNNNLAPKAYIGLIGFPCKIVVKIKNVTQGLNTHAGVMVSDRPSFYGGFCPYFEFVRRKTSTFEGLAVMQGRTTVLWSSAIMALPVYLRIRLGALIYARQRFAFDYGFDGVSWTQAYINTLSFTQMTYSAALALFCRNYITGVDKNQVIINFKYFIMRTVSL